MYILNNGIVEIKVKPSIRKLFCKHQFITGENCSSIGMTCLSGEDIVTVCKKCGKIKNRTFKYY